MVSADPNPQGEPAAAAKGKKSDDGQALITSFYDAVASGIRQRFKVISKQDIINWVRLKIFTRKPVHIAVF